MKKKKIVFIISSLIITIIFLILLFFLTLGIIDLPNLSYPLTGINGIVMFLFGIIGLIILEKGLYNFYKEKKRKKEIIISIILLVCGFVSFLIISPINTYIQNNNIGYRNLGYETYFVKGISYKIPKKWYTEDDGKNNYYHYPYVDKKKAMLYVRAVYDTNLDTTEYYTLDDYYNDFIDGMKEADSIEYFKERKKNKIKILNYNAIKLVFDSNIDGTFYKQELYLFIDEKSNTIYTFMFGYNDKINNEEKKEINKIINSIKEK